MQLKTSTLIARKFTAYVSGLLFLLGVLLNLIFFITWYRHEQGKVQGSIPIPSTLPGNNKIPRKQPRRSAFMPLLETTHRVKIDQEITHEIVQGKIRRNISYVDENYIIYTINAEKNEMIFSSINEQVHAQRRILRISCIFILLFTLITYGVSHFFVKSSLYRIHTLLTFVQGLSVHNLNYKVPILGPDDDEIQIIANKLQESLDNIKIQTDNLKDFISYASHELKTPLMGINALVDLGEKTGNYVGVHDKIKKSLSLMNNLIEQLLLQLKEQHHTTGSKEEQYDIYEVVRESIDQIKLLYPQHTIQVSQSGSLPYRVTMGKKHLHTIISNIVQNACKYSKPGTTVSIIIDKDRISIKDEGIGIATGEQSKIWGEFYRVHPNEDGYGLGLSLVKKIIDQHDRTIEVQSEIGKGSTFIIYYK